MPLPLLLLVRVGVEDRLAAVLRLVPFDDDFARPFDDDFARPLDDRADVDLVEVGVADVDFADVDFARPFDDAGFFALLVVRDAVVPLRALADLLRVLVDLLRVLAAFVPLLRAVPPVRFFAVPVFGLASAIGPPSEAVTGALPRSPASDPFPLQSGRFGYPRARPGRATSATDRRDHPWQTHPRATPSSSSS